MLWATSRGQWSVGAQRAVRIVLGMWAQRSGLGETGRGRSWLASKTSIAGKLPLSSA